MDRVDNISCRRGLLVMLVVVCVLSCKYEEDEDLEVRAPGTGVSPPEQATEQTTGEPWILRTHKQSAFIGRRGGGRVYHIQYRDDGPSTLAYEGHNLVDIAAAGETVAILWREGTTSWSLQVPCLRSAPIKSELASTRLVMAESGALTALIADPSYSADAGAEVHDTQCPMLDEPAREGGAPRLIGRATSPFATSSRLWFFHGASATAVRRAGALEQQVVPASIEHLGAATVWRYRDGEDVLRVLRGDGLTTLATRDALAELVVSGTIERQPSMAIDGGPEADAELDAGVEFVTTPNDGPEAGVLPETEGIVALARAADNSAAVALLASGALHTLSRTGERSVLGARAELRQLRVSGLCGDVERQDSLGHTIVQYEGRFYAVHSPGIPLLTGELEFPIDQVAIKGCAGPIIFVHAQSYTLLDLADGSRRAATAALNHVIHEVEFAPEGRTAWISMTDRTTSTHRLHCVRAEGGSLGGVAREEWELFGAPVALRVLDDGRAVVLVGGRDGMVQLFAKGVSSPLTVPSFDIRDRCRAERFGSDAGESIDAATSVSEGGCRP